LKNRKRQSAEVRIDLSRFSNLTKSEAAKFEAHPVYVGGCVAMRDIINEGNVLGSEKYRCSLWRELFLHEFKTKSPDCSKM